MTEPTFTQSELDAAFERGVAINRGDIAQLKDEHALELDAAVKAAVTGAYRRCARLCRTIQRGPDASLHDWSVVLHSLESVAENVMKWADEAERRIGVTDEH